MSVGPGVVPACIAVTAGEERVKISLVPAKKKSET